MKKYVYEKLKKINCEDVTMTSLFSKEDIKMLTDKKEKNKELLNFYSMFIAFANGVGYQKKKDFLERPMIEIRRASEKTIKTLIDMGIIYIGEDNEKHVNEFIPKRPTKAE